MKLFPGGLRSSKPVRGRIRRPPGDRPYVSMSVPCSEGSVRKDGSRLRIFGPIADTLHGFQLWSEIFDREHTSGYLHIQEEIAWNARPEPSRSPSAPGKRGSGKSPPARPGLRLLSSRRILQPGTPSRTSSSHFSFSPGPLSSMTAAFGLRRPGRLLVVHLSILGKEGIGLAARPRRPPAGPSASTLNPAKPRRPTPWPCPRRPGRGGGRPFRKARRPGARPT